MILYKEFFHEGQVFVADSIQRHPQNNTLRNWKKRWNIKEEI